MASKYSKIVTGVACLIVFVGMFTLSFGLQSKMALAQSNAITAHSYTLLEPLPCISDPQNPCKTASTTGAVPIMTNIDLGNFLQYAFNLLIAVAAAAAVFMMTYGGFMYVTTASWEKKSDGWAKFTGAIYGLLMVLGAYLVMRTVNPKLVQIPSAIPTVNAPGIDQSPLALFYQDQALQFFNGLNAEAQSYNSATNDYLNSLKATQNKVNGLTNQRDQLQKQLDALPPTDTANKSKLELQISQLNQQINDNKADAVMETVKTNISNAGVANTTHNLSDQIRTHTATFDSIDAEVLSGISYITQQQREGEARLSAVQAYQQITGPGGVDESALTALLMIKMVGVSTKMDLAALYRDSRIQGSTIQYDQYRKDLNGLAPTIFNEVQADIPKIQDPALKRQLQDKLDSSKNSLKQLNGDRNP